MEDAYALMVKHNKAIGTMDLFSEAFKRGEIPSEKMKIADDMDIDTDKLFDVTIDEAIKYLQSLPKDAILEERWSGYEDNYFVASKYVEEGDESMSSRIFLAFRDYLEKRNERLEEHKKQKRIEILEAELARLKGEKCYGHDKLGDYLE